MKIKYLGNKSTPKLDSYSPSFLDAIPRNNQHLNNFFGLDYWNAYEFSYLNSRNLPVIEALEIKISMHSLLTVESKSLKLYLASFYNKKFSKPASAYKLIEKDLTKILDSSVSVRKLNRFDEVPISTLISKFKNKVPKNKVTHFQGFRSICPVTSQPDFAKIYILSSIKIETKWLRGLLNSFKESGEFHEQCIEDIFSKLQIKYPQEKFEVCGRFLRRGGIDINPIRSSKKSLFFKNFRAFNQ